MKAELLAILKWLQDEGYSIVREHQYGYGGRPIASVIRDLTKEEAVTVYEIHLFQGGMYTEVELVEDGRDRENTTYTVAR